MATSGRSGALAVVLDVSARRLVLRVVSGGGSAAEPSVPPALWLDGPRCVGQEGGQAKIASGWPRSQDPPRTFPHPWWLRELSPRASVCIAAPYFGRTI